MAKTFGSWKNKLHGHFKKYAHDLAYARAQPPGEKLWGERSIDEWEWLCDELYTKEDYVVCEFINLLILFILLLL